MRRFQLYRAQQRGNGLDEYRSLRALAEELGQGFGGLYFYIADLPGKGPSVVRAIVAADPSMAAFEVEVAVDGHERRTRALANRIPYWMETEAQLRASPPAASVLENALRAAAEAYGKLDLAIVLDRVRWWGDEGEPVTEWHTLDPYDTDAYRSSCVGLRVMSGTVALWVMAECEAEGAEPEGLGQRVRQAFPRCSETVVTWFEIDELAAVQRMRNEGERITRQFVASSWLREIRFPSPRLSVAERPRQKPVSIPRTLSGPFAAMGYAPTKSTGQELELSKVLSSTLRIVVHALHVPNDGTLQCTLLFTTPAGGHAVRLPCDETGGYRHSIAHGIDELALNWAAAAARVEAILVPFLVEVYATGFGSRGGGAAS